MTFSVITCTYNAQDVLQRTLDSVARQTYTGVQHLIIDGASKDDTMRLVMDYDEKCKASDHDVLIVSAKDDGLYDAMNKGIALAKGEYLVFLNAGDTFHADDTLEKIAAQVEDNAVGVIYGNTDVVDNDGHFLHVRRLQPPEKLTWKSFRHGMLVCHQAFYARTDIAKAVKYNLRYKLSADVDWCIRVMKAAQKKGLVLHNTHMTLCNYLDGGMSVQNHKASLMERFRIMSHHYGFVTTVLMHFWFIFRKK